jgi:hypothetical protein
MGSFNATCIISNLQIEAGDPVRFLALVRSPYNQGNEHICYVAGRWQLRCPPLRAQYNDYGSIENLTPGLAQRVFFESFNRDVVEKGVGDNQCHDVQVRRGMTVDQWLEALWEGRVEIQDPPLRSCYPGGIPLPPEGVPTMARLEALFKTPRLRVVTGYGAAGFVLDEVAPGFIRIRVGQFATPTQEQKQLRRVLSWLSRTAYAAMMTCGTGNYSNHAEVLVAPAPLKEHFFSAGVAKRGDDNHGPRPVSQAMVREDVWQILLKTPLHDWMKGCEFPVAKMQEAARDALAEELKARGNPEDDYLDKLSRRDNHDNLFRAALHGNEGEWGFGLRESFDLALELHKSREELDAFVADLAETAYVQWAYATLHGQWQPTTNSSQDGNWKEHRAFLKALAKLKGKWEDER